MLNDPLPEGYDVHLFSNVLHDWDVPVVRQLIVRPRRALPAGGAIVVHDAFLNADKTGPADDRRLLRAADARHAGPLLLDAQRLPGWLG